MTAQEKAEKLNDYLKSGKTVIIRTATQQVEYTPKTASKFFAVGIDVFKHSGNSLFVARGKKYLCVDFCQIYIAE